MKTSEEQGEVSVMIARVMWPEFEWCNLGGPGAVNLHDGEHIISPFQSLNDCHEAAMWLRDTDTDSYDKYADAVRDYMKNANASQEFSPVFTSHLDAPAPVRASALAMAFAKIGEQE